MWALGKCLCGGAWPRFAPHGGKSHVQPCPLPSCERRRAYCLLRADVEGDMQLAWENLETARAIWNKDADAHHEELASEINNRSLS